VANSAHYKGKDLAEVRNPQRKLAPNTVGLEQREPTSLWDIAQRAKACKDHRFQGLYRMLDASLLLSCWDDLNKRSVSGVDKETAADYEQDLIGSILRLEERLTAKTYRVRLVRRVYIPKENGGERLLGIPALEDKLVQLALASLFRLGAQGQALADQRGDVTPGQVPRRKTRQLL